MPKGGLGNLIALPLQKHARDKGNSVFIDENFTPYPDQWDFLCKMRRISKKDLAVFIEKLGGANELGELQVEKDKSKPWETVSDIFDKSDFPDEVKIIKSGMLFIEKQGLTQKALNRIKRFAAFKNPEFYKAQAMRLPTYGKPRIISCSEDYEDYLALPRGCEDDIKEVLDENHVRLIMEDKLNTGRRINACFNGILRDDQEKAVKALNSYDTGVLSAATAFGKTIAAAKLISMKKVNTLVLVHRRQLLFQWIERLKTFLIIDETLPDQPEKRGFKKIL